MTADHSQALAEAVDLIPDGACVKLRLTIRRGGTDGAGAADRGLLRAARAPSGNVLLVDCAFTVTDGPHAGLAFHQSFAVEAGEREQDGRSFGWRTSRTMFRAVVDSASALDPDDTSDAAKARRTLRGFADLDGLTFAARVAIEPSRDPAYPDVNRLERVIPVTAAEWPTVMTGEDGALPSRDAEGLLPHSRPQRGDTPSTREVDATYAADAPPAAGHQPPVSKAGPAWFNG